MVIEILYTCMTYFGHQVDKLGIFRVFLNDCTKWILQHERGREQIVDRVRDRIEERKETLKERRERYKERERERESQSFFTWFLLLTRQRSLRAFSGHSLKRSVSLVITTN